MSAYTTAISRRPPAALPVSSGPTPVALTAVRSARRTAFQRPQLTYQSCTSSSVSGTGHFPGLASAAGPIDIGIAERHEPQREVAALEALGVEAHRHDRHIAVAAMTRQPVM